MSIEKPHSKESISEKLLARLGALRDKVKRALGLTEDPIKKEDLTEADLTVGRTVYILITEEERRYGLEGTWREGSIDTKPQGDRVWIKWKDNDLFGYLSTEKVLQDQKAYSEACQK